jgi:hypothetical protein
MSRPDHYPVPLIKPAIVAGFAVCIETVRSFDFKLFNDSADNNDHDSPKRERGIFALPESGET